MNFSYLILNTKKLPNRERAQIRPRARSRRGLGGWDDERREGRWGMELWGWRWMEMGAWVMREGERVGVVRGQPARSGGGVLGAAEAVWRALLGPRLEQN